ncbi:MAG: flavin reductase [Clostridia bacterium]|nr:flavin reductase [Clostridia bacterium]
MITIFKTINPKNIKDNLIKCFSEEWALITAGNNENYNMMTASWGFAGEMWGEDSIAVVVRPQRYTMEFIDKNDYFTVSFYGDRKDIHKICGSKSGRNVNKTAETGLTPLSNDKYVYFKEARMVLVVKKQFVQQMNPECFTDKSIIDKWYPENDFHNMIIGKIEKVLIAEQ